MWKQVHEALGYIHHDSGKVFLVKIDNVVAEQAEEFGVTRDIERLVGNNIHIAIAHELSDWGISQWPSLRFLADQLDIGDLQEIKDSFESNRVPIVYCGQTNESSPEHNAAKLAKDLRAEKLLFLTNRDGLLDDRGFLIHQMTVDSARVFLKTSPLTVNVNADILEKLDSAVWALDNSIGRVHIINGLKEDALYGELFTSEGIGTMVHNLKDYIRDRKAEKKDCPMIVDIIRDAEFPVAISPQDITNSVLDFQVRTYDNYVHGCVLYTDHENAKALELSYLATSVSYENTSDTKEILCEALDYAKKQEFDHVFMEIDKTQIWLGIYPWFLKLGFERRHLRDVFPNIFQNREDKEVWYLHL